MEIGLREWLIVIGIIVIAGILFDGWRRMRGGKGKLKFRLDRNLSNLPDDDGNAELLGPSRVLDTHKEPQLDEHDLPSVSAPARESRESAPKRGKRGHGEPSQGDMNLSLDLDGGPSFNSRDDDFLALGFGRGIGGGNILCQSRAHQQARHGCTGAKRGTQFHGFLSSRVRASLATMQT